MQLRLQFGQGKWIFLNKLFSPQGGDIVSEPTDAEIFEARWKKLEEELKEMVMA